MSAIKYGKFARRYAKKQPPPQIPETVRAEMFGRSDLEQASYLLQTLIAQLQKQDVDAIEGLSVTFSPLRNGQRVALKDEAGQPAAVLKIRLPPALRFSKATSL